MTIFDKSSLLFGIYICLMPNSKQSHIKHVVICFQICIFVLGDTPQSWKLAQIQRVVKTFRNG